MLAQALAGAATNNCRSVLAAAFRSSTVDWCHSLVNCIGCVLLWNLVKNEQQNNKEGSSRRLAFISLLHLLAEASNFSPNSNAQSTIASILAHLAINDRDPAVRSNARSTAIAIGQFGAIQKASMSSSRFSQRLDSDGEEVDIV